MHGLIGIITTHNCTRYHWRFDDMLSIIYAQRFFLSTMLVFLVQHAVTGLPATDRPIDPGAASRASRTAPRLPQTFELPPINAPPFASPHLEVFVETNLHDVQWHYHLLQGEIGGSNTRTRPTLLFPPLWSAAHLGRPDVVETIRQDLPDRIHSKTLYYVGSRAFGNWAHGGHQDLRDFYLTPIAMSRADERIRRLQATGLLLPSAHSFLGTDLPSSSSYQLLHGMILAHPWSLVCTRTQSSRRLTQRPWFYTFSSLATQSHFSTS